MEESLRFPALDGYVLAGDLFHAKHPRAAVVIGSATGVRRRIYRGVASHFAQEGMSTLTFDYRGIGDSAPERLRGFRATALDWGVLDLDAALAFMRERHPAVPLLFFAHSIGGQLFGLTKNKEHVSAALFVASQSGYWGHWHGRHRAKILFYWYLVVPTLLPVFGYLPMSKLLGGEDLPRGMAAQWASWGRKRDYVMSEPRAREASGFDAFHGALRAVAIEGDDDFAPFDAVVELTRFYRNAKSGVTLLRRVERGGVKSNHFSLFRPEFATLVWPQWSQWLTENA